MAATMSIQVGDRLPPLNLQEGTPRKIHNMGTLFTGKKASSSQSPVLSLPDAV